jgi:hypothetical protein
LQGDVTEAAFVALGGAVLTRARQRGMSLADLGLSMRLTAMLRRVVSPIGLMLPGDDQQTTRKAIRTVLGADVARATTEEELARSRALRLGRLARDAPADAATWGARLGMEEHGIERWVRETGPKPCPLCASWADGIPRPVTANMARHATCSCIQVPVL